MATRLQGDFVSNKESHDYTISIDDADFVGSATDFKAVAMSIEWVEPENGTFGVMPSFCSFSILVTSSTLNNFANALVGAEEGRFTIKIEKNSSLYWVGYVLTDLITIEDKPYPYVLSLRATDGIGRLKDIDYNNSGTAYSGKETVTGHLFNILGKIGLDSYWGASDIYLTSVVNWWEDSQTFANATDPWTVTRFDHRVFIRLDQSGNQSYFSAFQVLSALINQWKALFYHAGGRYYLIQTNEYAETGNVVLRHFVKAGTYDSNTVVASFSNTDKTWGNPSEYKAGSADLVGIADSPIWNFNPSLDHITVDYKHFSLQNLARDAAWNSESSTTYSLANIDSNSGDAKAAIRFYLSHKLDFNTNSFIISFMKFRFKVYIDNGSTIYYLKRVVNSPYVSTTVEWTTTDSNYEFYTNVQAEDDLTQYLQFSIITPDLPQDGDMSLKLTYWQAYDLDNQLINSFDYTETWIARNFYLEILVDGTLEGQSSTTRYRVNNTDATTNSAKVELEFLLGDGPTGNALGHYEVYDGSDWSNSSAWRKGSTGAYDFKINELFAREVLSTNITPVRKYVGRVLGDIEIYSTLVRDTYNLIASGVRFDMVTDIWDGEWFQISANPTPIDVAEEEEWVQTPENPSGGESGPTSDPGTPAPSQDGTPVTPTPAGDTGLTTPSFPDIFVAQEDQSIDEGSNITDFEIVSGNEDEIFFGDDSVILINPGTGEQQIVIIDPTVDHATGDTTVGILETVANYNFPAGSYIIANPVEQQANIQWGRRKFMDYQLVAFGTDLTTSTSYVNFDPFFRPYSAAATATGYQFEGKKYIRRVYFLCATNPSGSALVSYTAQVVRGSTPDVVASATITGQVTEATVTPNSGEELLQDDYYYFRIKQNSASGLSMNKGLHVMLEIINKSFAPDDITGLELWLRADADVYNDAGTAKCTNGQSVQEWHDQTTNSRDVTQTTAGNKPTWNTGGQNGYPYITFDGTDDYLVQSSVLGLTDYPFTIIVVFQQDSSASSEQSVVAINDNSGTGTDYHTIFADANTPALEAASKDGTEYSSTNYYKAGQFMIATGIWSGDTSRKVFFNLVAAPESTDSVNWDAAVLDEFLVGRLKNSGARRDFAGDIYEILVYSAALTDAERQQVYTYLARKYDVPNYIFEPDHLGGLDLWLDAGSEVYSDAGTTLATNGDSVQEWHNQAGASLDASQTTGAAQPTYNTGGPNGKPYLSFDGGDYLDVGAVSDFVYMHDTGGTVFIVVQPGTSSNPDALYGIIGNNASTAGNIGFSLDYDDRSAIPRNNRIKHFVSAGGGTSVASNVSADDVVTPNSNYNVITLVSDPDNGTAADRSSIYIDSGAAIANNSTSDASSSSNASNVLQIGANGNNTWPMVGGIAEVLIYDTPLSNSDRALVENYLSNKYNIT